MNIDRFNASGCYDPTAFEALTNIIREEKRKGSMRLVFVCSPYAGDRELHTKKAQRYCRFAVYKNCIPIAPHLLFPQFLAEDDEEERELGIAFGTVLLSKCSEVWAFGGRLSKGMSIEIAEAKKLGIPVRYFSDRCEEVPVYGISERAD